MEQTDLALAARLRGQPDQASLLLRAYELESKAALLANGQPEPTRSVLLRSAASLALDCNLIAESEKLICTALAGAPPPEIADELRDLYEQVNFNRHLKTRGVTLHDDEMQMSIAGRSIGFGIAPTEAFIDRVEKTEALLYRTAERKQQKPYRDRGRRDKALRESIALYMTVPRAASFAVTFKVGGTEQFDLFKVPMVQQVIDEMLECLDLFTRSDEIQLRARIKEEPYYRNFVGLAQGIAPDGREVDVVGFSTRRHGEVKEVALKARRETPLNEGASLMESNQASGETVIVSGVLKWADSLKEGRNEIQIVSADGRHRVVVPTGMMSDIVKPLWETPVTIKGVRKGRKISLQEIRPLDHQD
jgi:hypothetical protein